MGTPSSEDKARAQRQPGHCEPGLSLFPVAIRWCEPARPMILSEESQDKSQLFVGGNRTHRDLRTFHSTVLAISGSCRERELSGSGPGDVNRNSF